MYKRVERIIKPIVLVLLIALTIQIILPPEPEATPLYDLDSVEDDDFDFDDNEYYILFEDL